MPWEYNDLKDRVWQGPNGWEYDPFEPSFYLNGEPKEKTEVPKAVRESLEITARDLISNATEGATIQQLSSSAVQISNKFYQGEITNRVTLGNTTFGSKGAAPCLIVFATGTRQGANVAVGAHLDNEVYCAPDETVQTIINNLDLDQGSEVKFYIFGGEVGSNTNPGDESKMMDYSRYYPFFCAIDESPNATVECINFPSNGNGDTATDACITATSVRVWHHDYSKPDSDIPEDSDESEDSDEESEETSGGGQGGNDDAKKHGDSEGKSKKRKREDGQ